jgi:hypothetical protein
MSTNANANANPTPAAAAAVVAPAPEKRLYAIEVVQLEQLVRVLGWFAHPLDATQHMLTLYPHARCVGVRPATQAEQLAHQCGHAKECAPC